MSTRAKAAALSLSSTRSNTKLLFALTTALALLAAIPSLAHAAPTKQAPAKSQSVKTSFAQAPITDFSAARRHHRSVARRASVRNAYGAIVGGPVYAAPSYSSGFGYGYGDNSRNQTW